MTMKMAEICPVYKKLDNLSKENYRSVNLFIMFSKVFERLMAEQLTNYFENILNPLVSAYRKGYVSNMWFYTSQNTGEKL